MFDLKAKDNELDSLPTQKITFDSVIVETQCRLDDLVDICILHKIQESLREPVNKTLRETDDCKKRLLACCMSFLTSTLGPVWLEHLKPMFV